MKQPPVQKGSVKPKGVKPKPFDLWLKQGLHQIYDKVANEPIPDELLKLIEEDRTK